MPTRTVSERAVVFLIGSIQFINILDFMMVMPLGPDFALGLGIPSSKLAVVGGSYTAAACVSGLLGSFVLERFDRRRALFGAMLGLVVGTAAGGLATGLGTLVAARLLAGFFGGPATSLALSIVADLVPPQRRGRVLGAVMGAASVAAVLGVPAGLELARLGGWRLPFFAVAGAGAVITTVAAALLPSMPPREPSGKGAVELLRALLGRRVVQLSYLMTATVMVAGFLLIPNFSAFFQFNLGFPRDRIQYLYMVGGLSSFLLMRVAGKWIDRLGPTRVVTVASLLLVAILITGFWAQPPLLPVFASFVLFMTCMSVRNVGHSTLTSLVPSHTERARFMSIQSAVQHLGSALGAFGSSVFLTARPDRSLGGMRTVLALNLMLTVALPWLFRQVELRVRRSAPSGEGA